MDGDHAAMNRAWAPRSSWPWVFVALALVGPFLLWPLGAMFWRAVSPGGEFSLEPLDAVLQEQYYWERLVFTTAQAAASTGIAVLVGLPAAYVFARVRFPGRGLFLALVTVPFV